MASKQGMKSKNSSSKAANSPPSSTTTSSSKMFPDNSAECLSSPTSSAKSKAQYFYSDTLPVADRRSKENVTVTVRFRPLSPKEIRRGEEIAWYADGETIVRSEHNSSTAFAYDRVFGPTTTTRHVYDVAAQHIVGGAMEGVNGTIFAYGVTSSGKTHTMHGDQRSPGIIALAVKDAFSIIQETPSREYLLRVSYLEIYNEVVNDLLNPAGQNLRIREDAQGTFVEGIKEEVILSPAHALSLIAAGEEHRHVGSTNFNLLSSRSHTIFTLTIESSPCGENTEGEAVNLSQLNLIDLAGSESSKAETTGVRRKEGSYINKSLLTLGTVISKLTDGKVSHIPYRDSKLTRLLQSSLSGHGRVSLISTVTPSSSNSEETHNTLKFAHRAKHIEIQAAQNKIIDEKSLIKKYQNEIRCLKEELEELEELEESKKGVVTVPQLKNTSGDDLVVLKQKLEDGEYKLQSRLEQEEEAKAALMSRIQRLTKLILVSTKSTQSSRYPHRPGPKQGYSLGEKELAYLPFRRRDLILDDENIDLYVSLDSSTEIAPDYTLKEEKKTKKHGLLNWLKPKKRDSLGASASEKSSGVKSVSSTPSTPPTEIVNYHVEPRHSHSLLSESTPSAELFSEARQDLRDIPNDNFLQEQTPLAEFKRMDEEIRRKDEEVDILEKNIAGSFISSLDVTEGSRSAAELEVELNEKALELEEKTADNRIIQEQLTQKICECEELEQAVSSLRQHLSEAVELQNLNAEKESKEPNKGLRFEAQAFEIKQLKHQLNELTESNQELEHRNKKLAEESSYAKGLASAAAVELKALSEEVANLMNHNAKLSAEIAAHKSPANQRNNNRPITATRNGRREITTKNRHNPASIPPEVRKELALSQEREQVYEAALAEKDQNEADLQRRIEESKQRETYLENELANMWVLVAKLKKSQGSEIDKEYI